MISPRGRAAVIASAAAAMVGEPLILDGITGAISEWDGQNSTKTGDPITQWDDLITTNHLVEDHNTGTGAVPATINGRAALDFTPTQHYSSGIVMPAPSTGFTICAVLRPHDVATNQIVLGRRGNTATSGGFSIWVQSVPTYRLGLSDGVSGVFRGAATGAAAANTTAIVQGGYDGSSLKIKVNDAAPLTAAHSLTNLSGETNFGMGSTHGTATIGGYDGDILWVGVCSGLLSNTDMDAIATRLNARFSVF